MAYAIKMELSRPRGEYDPCRSRFYGDPAIPAWMEAEIGEDEVFLAQINLSEIAAVDRENLLPHEGWLYFFFRAEDGSAWTPKEAVVRYSKEAPQVVLVDFNADSPIPEGLNEPYLIDFETAKENNGSGMKLLGEPFDWNYAEPAPGLLLQYDPLDSPSEFLSEMDGMVYFFMGEDREKFSDARWHGEYS